MFMYEVSLIIIKKQVGKKRVTTGSHWNPDSLLKTRPPNVTNKLSIKKSSILIMSVSENSLFESE